MTPRIVISVAEVAIPPVSGDEAERRWRGTLYDSGDCEYFTGEEFIDWNEVPPHLVPDPVRVCIEYLLAWRALEEPDELDDRMLGV